MLDQPQPLALYIHWPFCLSKCPYCDFNSHVRESIDEQRWHNALLRELDFMAERIGTHWRLSSIFFGGGTPSLMPPRTVAALIARASTLWTPLPDIEITLEANPTSSEAEKFKEFRSAGVNRASLGVQSLRKEALAFLGREHSANEAVTAVKLAADIFPRYSIDLIYARPNQDPEDWKLELKHALTLIRGHISLYQLTMEQGTAFYPKYQRGEIILPPEDTAVALYEMTGEICGNHGIEAYEISNYAKRGEASRHNMSYWQGDAYVGIGAGAHGRIQLPNGTWMATSTLKSPERWLDQTEKTGHGIEHYIAIDALDRAEEMLITGLRLKRGVHKPTILQRTGIHLDSLLDKKATLQLSDQGLLNNTEHYLTLTDDGRLLLDSIINIVLKAPQEDQ